jgi:dienelactone hydrolase
MIKGLLNTEKIGVIGFSMGGGGCIKAINPIDNEEIDAAVALAPAIWDGNIEVLPEVTVPTMLQVGSIDDVMKFGDLQTGLIEEIMDQYFDGYWPFPFGHVNSNIYDVYNLIPDSTPKSYVEINGGNHVGFFNELIYDYDEASFALYDTPILLLFQMMDSEPTISMKYQHRISRKYFTAWFQYFLKDLYEYETYIFGETAENDLNSGVLSDWEYNIP